MAKVLKITKSDKTVHVMPLTNKAFYESYNRRQPGNKKWKIEVVEEADVKDHPFIDDTHTTPADAVIKNTELTKQLSEKDKKIAELEAMLAGKNGAGSAPAPLTATEKITAIAEAATVAQVKEIVGDDERKTVIAAADKKIAELEAK